MTVSKLKLQGTLERPSDSKSNTPLMKQYWDHKLRFPDSLLFFRVGDFYELFYSDAEIVCENVDLVLTKRHGIQMCGMPHHASKNYIGQLLKNGFKIAICDQTQSADQAKGLITRDVTEVLSPGILFDEERLDDNSFNYFCSFRQVSEDLFLAAFVDVSIGSWRYGEVTWARLLFWIDWFKPTEIILEKEQIDKYLLKLPDDSKDKVSILNHPTESPLEEPGFCETNPFLKDLFEHLYFFQPKIDHRMQKISPLKNRLRMNIDPMVLNHLEIFQTRSGKRGSGTLFHTINFCKTAGGSRVLISNLKSPLIDYSEIEKRQNMVFELVQKRELRKRLRELLSLKFDFERICQKLSVFKVNPKNLLQLLGVLRRIPELKQIGEEFTDLELIKTVQELKTYESLVELLSASVSEECLGVFKEGSTIKSGFDAKLDELRAFKDQSSEILLALEQRYRDETGVSNLKVKYNRVFGYLVEVSRSNVDKLPPVFERRQTLTNYERFSTPELKEIEAKILSAQEQSEHLEKEIFEGLVEKCFVSADELFEDAKKLSYLDFIAGLAELANAKDYNLPRIKTEKLLNFKALRHPVVEAILPPGQYVPTDFDLGDKTLALITGPNMAGKSTIIRAVALSVILAQIGSYLPARSAEIGLVDGVFTRVGASDDISRGQSTFMVEMAETARILNESTEQSLVILDEIGRGTSTFDGVSIAWALCEELIKVKACRALFATHYHELCEVEKSFQRKVTNYHVKVSQEEGSVRFLYNLEKGGASQSFGIEVAKLAGLPAGLTRRSYEILSKLESGEFLNENQAPIAKVKMTQKKLFKSPQDVLWAQVKELDINGVSPIESWNLLSDLKKKIVDLDD